MWQTIEQSGAERLAWKAFAWVVRSARGRGQRLGQRFMSRRPTCVRSVAVGPIAVRCRKPEVPSAPRSPKPASPPGVAPALRGRISERLGRAATRQCPSSAHGGDGSSRAHPLINHTSTSPKRVGYDRSDRTGVGRQPSTSLTAAAIQVPSWSFRTDVEGQACNPPNVRCFFRRDPARSRFETPRQNTMTRIAGTNLQYSRRPRNRTCPGLGFVLRRSSETHESLEVYGRRIWKIGTPDRLFHSGPDGRHRRGLGARR